MDNPTRRNWQAFLRRLLVSLGEPDPDDFSAPASHSPANPRVSWEDEPPPGGSRFDLETRQAGPQKKSLRVKDGGRVEWGGGSAFSPDSLVGVEDAYEHTPLLAGEKVAFCKYDKVAYHLSTWKFLKEYNQGRCCSCSRADQMVILTLPGAAPAVQALPAARPDLRNLPVIGLKEIEQYIGRAVMVQDHVYDVHRSQKGTYFVKFQPRSQAPRPFDGFKVVIFPNLVKVWEQAGVDPRAYAGQTVRVRGVIAQNETWGLEVIASSPRLIQVVAGEEPAGQ